MSCVKQRSVSPLFLVMNVYQRLHCLLLASSILLFPSYFLQQLPCFQKEFHWSLHQSGQHSGLLRSKVKKSSVQDVILFYATHCVFLTNTNIKETLLKTKYIVVANNQFEISKTRCQQKIVQPLNQSWVRQNMFLDHYMPAYNSIVV